MSSGTVPGGKYLITIGRSDDTVTLTALGSSLEVEVYRTWANNLGGVQSALFGLDVPNAFKATNEKRLVLSHLKKPALSLPGRRGFDCFFFCSLARNSQSGTG